MWSRLCLSTICCVSKIKKILKFSCQEKNFARKKSISSKCRDKIGNKIVTLLTYIYVNRRSEKSTFPRLWKNLWRMWKTQCLQRHFHKMGSVLHRENSPGKVRKKPKYSGFGGIMLRLTPNRKNAQFLQIVSVFYIR